MDLRHNFHISRQGSDYVIVRTVSDYADQLDPPDIYWAWVRITTDSLTPDDESEGAASEETIEDVFDDGGSIVNLGTDLNNPLNIPLSKSDMFVKVLEWPVVDVGTRLHSSCLDEAANPRFRLGRDKYGGCHRYGQKNTKAGLAAGGDPYSK